MNRSGNTSYNSPPGFVYFNTSFQNTPEDTQDFISFQESPTSNSFNRYNSNYGSPNFHSSPKKFNNRNTYRYSGGSRGNSSYYNNNFNKSWGYQKSPHYNHRKSFNRTPMMNSDGSRDMSNFFDPTCIENPWEQLEKDLELEKPHEKSNSEVNNEEESSSSESEDEETGSSTSVEKEETP